MKKKGKVWLWKRTAVVLGSLVVLLYLPSVLHAQATLKIGAAVSMTGKLAREGSYMKKGYDAWADWVNGKGGIKVAGKTYKVQMIYYDDKADATTAAKLTEKLITEDKVNFILGPYSSGITAATSAIAEKYHYVTIAPVANGDFVYQRGFKYLFSVFPMATMDLIPVAEMAVKQTPKPKTFGCVVLDSAFTLPDIDGVSKKSEELGLKQVYYGKYPVGTTDFSGIITALKEKKPDLLYYGGYFPDAVAFYRQAKELNFNAMLYTTTGTAGLPDWVKVMGKDGDYVLGEEPWHQDMSYKGKYFTSRSFYDYWMQKYHEPVTFWSAAGFVAGRLMQMALEKAGSLDQDKLRDALRSMNVETFFGKFKFDSAGRNVAARMGIIQIQNEKPVLIYPPRPGVKLLYPVPPWNKR